jgi:hypothetical protein
VEFLFVSNGMDLTQPEAERIKKALRGFLRGAA